MRILVHDSRYRSARFRPLPSLAFLSGEPGTAGQRVEPARWTDSFTSRSSRPMSPIAGSTGSFTGTGIPCCNRYGPIRDHYAYNGGDVGTDNAVADLSLEASLALSRGCRDDLPW